MSITINAIVPVHVTNTILEPKQITQTVHDQQTNEVRAVSKIICINEHESLLIQGIWQEVQASFVVMEPREVTSVVMAQKQIIRDAQVFEFKSIDFICWTSKNSQN